MSFDLQYEDEIFAKTPEDLGRARERRVYWRMELERARREANRRLDAEARGPADAAIVLDDAPDLAENDFDIHGLAVPADAASILIAHGDSLKSMIVLFVLGTLAQRGHRVMLCDWEWSAARHKARKRRMFGPTRLDGLAYMRCRAPLVIEVNRIREHCDRQQIEFIGIDSVGLACDGKLIDDDVAIRFHRALGTLPPALCTAHVPKSSLGPDGKGDAIGPFGSVFFSNLCRASWLVKKETGGTENIVTVGLFPQKQNDGARNRPVGLQFGFDADQITVIPINLADVDGLAERIPLPTRIAHALKRGPLTYAQIAEQLNAKPDSVMKAVNRGKAFAKVSGHDGALRIALKERRHVA
jgi:hypothetical protein